MSDKLEDYYKQLATNLERGANNRMLMREGAAAIRTLIEVSIKQKAQLDATERTAESELEEANVRKMANMQERVVELEGAGMRGGGYLEGRGYKGIRSPIHQPPAPTTPIPTTPMPNPSPPPPPIKPGIRRFAR